MLAAFAALSAFSGQGSLLSSDDVLYGMMAREMVASGNLLEPTWMGALVMEKPPLLLWCLSLCGTLFGWGEQSMRLVGILCGVGIVGWAIMIVRRTEPQGASAPWLGWLVALLFIATNTFVIHVRRPITDPLLVFSLLGALYGAARMTLDGGRRWEVLTGLSMGLAVLSKGLAAGPAALVLLVALVVGSRGRSVLPTLRAVLLSAVVCLPWHGWMLWRHGRDFWDTTVGYHLLGRVQTPLVGQTGHETYLQILGEADPLMAWLLLLGLLATAWVAWSRRGRPEIRWVAAVVVAMAALTALVVQVSATRLFHYLLPVAALGVIATALALRHLLEGRLVPVRRAILAGVFSLGVVALATSSSVHLLNPDYSPRSRMVGDALRGGDIPDGELIVWERYDPALFWYSGRSGQIWASDPGFLKAQLSVDMMRRSGVVIPATEALFTQLASAKQPRILAVPVERQPTFEPYMNTLLATGRLKGVALPDAGYGLLWLEAIP